ncbi:MAG: phosphoglycerate mutase family protein [Candidatus Peregrinibacteria bacterium]
MKKTVNVYVMRHGQKQSGVDGDLAALTEIGRKQVIDSAAKNLVGIKFDGLYCSLKFRALETVVCAISVLPEKNNGLSVIAREAFDYSASIPDIKQYFKLSARVNELAKERDQPITVALWNEVTPEIIGHFAKKMHHGIIHAAWEVTEDKPRQIEFNVLIGCHSPGSELVTLDPENTPLLREADIFFYRVELSDETGTGGRFQLTESRLIDRGF